MKTPVLMPNSTNTKTISKNKNLKKINENAYYYIHTDKGTTYRDPKDLYITVLKVNDVYFQADGGQQKIFFNQPQTKERIKEVSKDVQSYVLSQTNKFLLDVAQAANLDTNQIKQNRKQKQERIKKAREEAEAERIQEEQQRKKEEAEKLNKAKTDWKEGNQIQPDSFITLCEINGITIHPRTKGTLNSRIVSVSKHGCRFTRSKGQARPGTNKIIEHVNQLTETLK